MKMKENSRNVLALKADKLQRRRSGLEFFDEVFYDDNEKGLPDGALVVITGANGIGKSTFLYQLLDSYGQYKNTVSCLFNNELDPSMVKSMAHRLHLKNGFDLYDGYDPSAVMTLIREKVKNKNRDQNLVIGIDAVDGFGLPGQSKDSGKFWTDLRDLAKLTYTTIFVINHLQIDGENMYGNRANRTHSDVICKFMKGKETKKEIVLQLKKNRFGPQTKIENLYLDPQAGFSVLYEE